MELVGGFFWVHLGGVSKSLVCGLPLAMLLLGGYFFYSLALSHWFWSLLWIDWHSFRASTFLVFLSFLFIPFLIWGYFGNHWYTRALRKKLAAKQILKGPRLSMTLIVAFLLGLS